MSLLDRLRPKWKHPDPAVRLTAVGQLDDQALLESIVEQDANENVRAAALRAIRDEAVIKRLAMSSASVATRELAVEKIADPLLLQRISASDPSPIVRAQARAKCAVSSAGVYLRDTLSKLQVAERQAEQMAEFCGTLTEVCQALSRDPRFFINGDVAPDHEDETTAQLRDMTRVAWETATTCAKPAFARFIAQSRQPENEAPAAPGLTRFYHVKVWRTGEDRFDLVAEEKQFRATNDAAAWSRASGSGPDIEPALDRSERSS